MKKDYLQKMEESCIQNSQKIIGICLEYFYVHIFYP